MTKGKKIIIFIITFIIIVYLNVGLLNIYEYKTGLKFSRWVTFLAPILITYFVIFKSNKEKKSNDEKSYD
jgi:hypothetical protein